MKRGLLLTAIVGIAVFFVAHSCSTVSYEGNKMRIEKSQNFKDGKFVNWHPWEEPGFVEMIKTAWVFYTTDNDRKPEIELPKQQVDLNYFNETNTDQLQVTWIGHSSLLINLEGYRILTDPVFETSVTMMGPSRFNGDAPIKPRDLDDIDVVVISHDHYDHLNKHSIQIIEPKTKQFIVPLGIRNRLTDWNVPREKIVELDWWEETEFDQLTFAATPAQHFSGRGLNDRNKTLWASFVIKSENYNLFFSGDSGYFEGFKEIGDKYGPFDMTFIECGAYDERWHYVHMFPEETVQAHIDLKGKLLHPIHWGTFDLALHSWYEPMERLASAARKSGVSIAVPIVGETTVFNGHVPNLPWWNLKVAELKN